jgi:hypothetical protein
LVDQAGGSFRHSGREAKGTIYLAQTTAGMQKLVFKECRRPNDAEVPQADVDDLEGFARSRCQRHLSPEGRGRIALASQKSKQLF